MAEKDFTLNELLALAEDESKWFHLGQWVQPTLSMCFWSRWAKRKSYERMGLPKVSGVVLQCNGHHLSLKPDFQVVAEKAGEAAEKRDDSFFQKLMNLSEEACASHLRLATEFEDLRESGLAEKFSAFVNFMNDIITPWTVVILTAMGVDGMFAKKLEKHGLKQIELAAHYAGKPTMIMKQEREARAFAQYLRDAGLMHLLDEKPAKAVELLSREHRQLAERINAHLKEFEWVGTHHCWGEPLSMERLFSQVKEMPFSDKKFEAGLRELPEEIAWLIKWQNEFAYWRQYCAETSDVAFFKARPLLHAVARKIGLSYEQVIWLSDREILRALEGGEKPSVEEIREREKGFGYLETEDEEIVFTGKRLAHFIDVLVPKVDSTVKQFVGVVGSKGFAVGRALVALTPQEAVGIKKGEILVVPQTTPDFVIFMRKAGAIVTEEGGITCHAAIVSRELGVPCVVGTKVATRVLKTGDLVEVDANSGVVKKL